MKPLPWILSSRDIERRVKEGDWPCEDHDCGKYSGCPYEVICTHGWDDNLLGIHFRQKEPNIKKEVMEDDSGTDE